jgi:cytoskeletal protein RodZ
VDFADFGKYLSQQRELRGMSREEMSRVTKIPPSLLAALEEGLVERLPERLYVLHYVRSYAQVLGLEEEETLLRFEEAERQAAPPPPEEEAAVVRPTKKRAGVALALLGAVLALAAALAWLSGHMPGAGAP